MLAMAWMWWLLAPLLSTAAGAALLSWRGRAESRSGTLRPGNAIVEHRAMLHALSRVGSNEPLPVNLVLISAPVEAVEVAGS
ncbi:MAG: hypothetical protein QOD87_1596 [Pseudonocardiales bacterium]|nr:hypothetical protein [Pseudonocardiales bacterium]